MVKGLLPVVPHTSSLHRNAWGLIRLWLNFLGLAQNLVKVLPIKTNPYAV